MKRVVRKVLKHPLYLRHQEKVRFLMVGGFNSVLDFSIFGILAVVLSLPDVPANLISTTICTGVSFVLNYRFVWRSKRGMMETAPKFVAISLFSAWVLQSLVIWSVLGIFGGGEGTVVSMVAKLAGMAVGMVFNYLGYKYIFR